MSRESYQPLAFEKYLYFYREPIFQDLNTKQLKQILFMHGLEKLSNHSKEEITDAVRSLHLISPTRSTVNMRSAQFIPTGIESTPSLEDVKKDIRDIEWEECPVGSIVAFSSANLGPLGCAKSDNSFSLMSNFSVPHRPRMEGDGSAKKRFRINKKKENAPLLHVPSSFEIVGKPHSNPLKLTQGAPKVIHVSTSNLNDVDAHR